MVKYVKFYPARLDIWSECLSPLRFAQGQALSPFASLRGNSAKGLARRMKRSFAALRMTGLDLAGGEELSSAFEPCLMKKERLLL